MQDIPAGDLPKQMVGLPRDGLGLPESRSLTVQSPLQTVRAEESHPDGAGRKLPEPELLAFSAGPAWAWCCLPGPGATRGALEGASAGCQALEAIDGGFKNNILEVETSKDQSNE